MTRDDTLEKCSLFVVFLEKGVSVNTKLL
jgi:hypothetical protein